MMTPGVPGRISTFWLHFHANLIFKVVIKVFLNTSYICRKTRRETAASYRPLSYDGGTNSFKMIVRVAPLKDH